MIEKQSYTFDGAKAVEAILYIATCAPKPDIYHLCKILYFADKKHLERYGRLISDENYVAMKNGPAPSAVYDLLKYARGDGNGITYATQPIQFRAIGVRMNNSRAKFRCDVFGSALKTS